MRPSRPTTYAASTAAAFACTANVVLAGWCAPGSTPRLTAQIGALPLLCVVVAWLGQARSETHGWPATHAFLDVTLVVSGLACTMAGDNTPSTVAAATLLLSAASAAAAFPFLRTHAPPRQGEERSVNVVARRSIPSIAINSVLQCLATTAALIANSAGVRRAVHTLSVKSLVPAMTSATATAVFYAGAGHDNAPPPRGADSEARRAHVAAAIALVAAASIAALGPGAHTDVAIACGATVCALSHALACLYGDGGVVCQGTLLAFRTRTRFMPTRYHEHHATTGQA